jgi:hypothetical protein
LEVFVTIIARRKFLAGAGASSLSSFSPFKRWAAPHSSECISIAADDDELPHGCIFARTDGKRSPPGDALTAPSIDFWTFRVSEIESSTLAASAGRVIIWDDLFLPRNLARSVKSILEVFTKWYGFDPLLGRCSFHLEGFSEIGPVTQAVLPATTRPIRSSRLALIDVESCGVSRIDWPDILVYLRNSYDVVIGFAHFAGPGPSHPHDLSNGALDNSRTSNIFDHCDLSFWTNDSLLGFEEVPDCEARAPILGALVCDLIHALSATDLAQTLAEAPEAPRLFADRLRPDGHSGNLTLGYDENGALLIDGRIVL